MKKTKKIKKKTIYAKLFDIDKKLFTHIFKNWNIVTKKYIMTHKYVDMMLLFGYDMFDKDLWNVKSTWKSRITLPNLTNKFLLHQKFKSYYFIPKTFLITTSTPNLQQISTKYNDNIWIWRNDNKAGGGQDVQVIYNQQQLNEIHQNFMKKYYNPKSTEGGTNALLTKYITHPDLWTNPTDGKKYKYHIRIYYLIVVSNEEKHACIFKNAEIVLAEEPYITDDWSNINIHDTHFKHGWAHFPEDYNSKYSSENILKQITDILHIITKKTINDIPIYNEASYNFQILGCDFMIDEHGKAFLIEINSMPSFQYKGKIYKGTTRNTNRKYIQKITLDNVINYVVNHNRNLKIKLNHTSNHELPIIELY